jgi:hypothetical protein
MFIYGFSPQGCSGNTPMTLMKLIFGAGLGVISPFIVASPAGAQCYPGLACPEPGDGRGQKPATEPRPSMPAPALSEAQAADLNTLLDVAASYIIYHRGRFADRLTGAIPRQYLDSGSFFFPEAHRRRTSSLGQPERAAVASKYNIIIGDIFAAQPNARLYSEIAGAINAARKLPR